MTDAGSMNMKNINEDPTTFTMCNMCPQTTVSNNVQWANLESNIILNYVTTGNLIAYVFQGPLFNNDNTCIVSGGTPQLCGTANANIPIPYAFWKILVQVDGSGNPLYTWTWIYTQSTGTSAIQPSNTSLSTFQPGPSGLIRIENELGVQFPAILKTTSQTTCTICNASVILYPYKDDFVGVNVDNGELVNHKTGEVYERKTNEIKIFDERHEWVNKKTGHVISYKELTNNNIN